MNKRLLPPRLADLIPGATWRAASIAARVGFLLLVFPLTLPGELGAFFSYSSLGVLVGRVISFGALDNLPIKVRGNTSAMVDAYRAILPLSIMAILATFAAASTGSLLLMSGALALSLASGLALAGAVRSVNAALFEQWMNIHPIFLLTIALLYGHGLTANVLLFFQSLSLLVGQVALLKYCYREHGRRRSQAGTNWFARVGSLASGGFSKMVSDSLLTACVRGIAIGPILFGMDAISDELAIGLMLGEAALTVGMILVHRNFSFYCAAQPDRNQTVKSAVILLLGIGTTGIVGAFIVHILSEKWPFSYIDPLLLAGSFIFFSGITALSEFRYFDVACKKPLLPWITAQVIFVALTFGLVFFPVHPYVTLFLFISTSIPAFFLLFFHKYKFAKATLLG